MAVRAPTGAPAGSHARWLSPLSVDEAVRRGLCMLPMLVAGPLGFGSVTIAVGQAAFFYGNQPLPTQSDRRLMAGLMLLALGLSFYLLGGNVVGYFWLAGLYTLVMGIVVGMLSNWSPLNTMAFSFVSLYSAGLNAGSSEKAATSFLAFAAAMLWSLAVSVLPFWRGADSAPHVAPLPEHVETGVRLGIGASLAYFIAELFNFSRLGWSVAAVGSVVRLDEDQSPAKARARTVGTIAGALLATAVLVVSDNPTYLLVAGYLGGVLNGLLARTRFAGLPLFYTATILILYSMNDPTSSATLRIERIAYNLVGVLIGLAVVYYPFPLIMRLVRSQETRPDPAGQIPEGSGGDPRG